jgi:hypothetical protein
VPGGLLLAAYAVFGFVAGYLWSRRYLGGELAAGRKEMITTSRRDAESRSLERARVGGLMQTVPRSAIAAGEAERAVSEASGAKSGALSRLTVVGPGAIANDPWKGQFGGKSSDARAEVTASVSELKTAPGLFQIDIRVRGIDESSRGALKEKPVRIYLHPTFSDPIRTANFDLTGELRLPLVGYGAFTVGVQFEDDAKLELDLATLPGVPEQFRLS